MIELDRTNRRLYMFASPNQGGAIYYKSTPMDDVSFGDGGGDTFISWSGATLMNDASGAKDPVDSTTGLLVLASDSQTFRYYHGELGLAAPAP